MTPETGHPRPDRTVILSLDTATTRVVVAVGSTAGTLLEATEWPAGYRHGETLLPTIVDLFDRRAVARSSVAAVVVGTGPGAFTGLRVGIATAKGLAHALGVPIVGVSTADAILAGAETSGDVVLLLPAGPSDRIVVGRGQPPTLVRADEAWQPPDGVTVVAIDLPDRAPEEALARGETAVARLGGSLIAIGAARLAAGDIDDLALVVPQYVTLPRGVSSDTGEVTWSRGPR